MSGCSYQSGRKYSDPVPKAALIDIFISVENSGRKVKVAARSHDLTENYHQTLHPHSDLWYVLVSFSLLLGFLGPQLVTLFRFLFKQWPNTPIVHYLHSFMQKRDTATS